MPEKGRFSSQELSFPFIPGQGTIERRDDVFRAGSVHRPSGYDLAARSMPNEIGITFGIYLRPRAVSLGGHY